MIHELTSLCLLVTIAAALPAQEEVAEAMPNPKTEHHEHFARLAGTWRTKTDMAAMPGVPGMEKATEALGTERAELVCDGLWLKVSGQGEFGGQPVSGVWLLGYDPVARSYQCIAVSSMEGSACSMTASYTPKSRTWHFEGDTPMGPLRSVFVLENDDRSVETCYTTGPDGKDVEFMRIVRTRVKGGDVGGVTAEAAASAAKPDGEKLPAAVAALRAEIGKWDAEFKMQMPGAPAMTSKCREVIQPICGGKWTWSDFTGELMGAPFEGHALTGYDGQTGKVVSYWIDSMSGACMKTEGTYDADDKCFHMTGTSYDEAGELAPVASTSKATGKDSRRLRMVFGEGDAKSVMTIDYTRSR